jgi:hypothetical protein
MITIINYIFITAGTLLAFLLVTVFVSVSSWSGVAGGMALVAISSMFKPLIIISLVIIATLLACAFLIDHLANPIRFWLSISVIAAIVLLGFGIFLSI